MDKPTIYITVSKETREVIFSVVYCNVAYDYLVVFSDLAFGEIPKIVVLDRKGKRYLSDDLSDEEDVSVIYKRNIRKTEIRITEQPEGQRSIAFTY